MRLHLLLLLSFLASSLAALRGERNKRPHASIRSLNTKEKTAKVDETKTTKTKEEKMVKKTKDAKKAKENKCKKVKKAKKSTIPSSEDSTIQDNAPPGMAPVVEKDDVPYCLHGERSQEECEALSRGEVPTGNDKSAQGHLGILAESQNNSDDVMLSKVQNILRTRTAPKFAGCPEMKRFLLLKEEGDKAVVEESVTVTGLEVGDLKVSEKGTLYNDGMCGARGLRLLSIFSKISFDLQNVMSSQVAATILRQTSRSFTKGKMLMTTN